MMIKRFYSRSTFSIGGGNKLFVQEDVLLNQAQSWDGKYYGVSVNPGVYIYVVEVLVNDKVESYYGDLTVIR